jgi:glutamyl-tRNA synthetase
MTKPVKTRFAPSPTGMLHIGGARTALFSKLYAKHTGGEYVVRIEDTDRERSTQAAVDAIKDGLNWLDLGPDNGQYVFQTSLVEKHTEAAHKMLKNGTAYKCFVAPEELDAMRKEAEERGEMPKYDGRHRNLTPEQIDDLEAKGVPFAVRIKLPLDGSTVWEDAVQGRIEIANTQLDDFVLLRSDGTPTYNLAVVVDDAEMEITHVIRGDDHINNTPKQIHIYEALGLDVPTFAHLPLIHGKDGKKLSKRTGSVDVMHYKDMGYLPTSLNNYLMRLGWGMGDKEVISFDEAVEAFELTDVNKGASIFDFDKLDWLNGEYIKQMNNNDLFKTVKPFFELDGTPMSEAAADRVSKLMDALKPRARRLTDFVDVAQFCLFDGRPGLADAKAEEVLGAGMEHVNGLADALDMQDDWSEASLDGVVKTYIKESGAKFPAVGMPVRVALTGTTQAPSVGAILSALGKEESLKRLGHGA